MQHRKTERRSWNRKLVSPWVSSSRLGNIIPGHAATSIVEFESPCQLWRPVRRRRLPREATNAGLNARHESNLPRQLLDICGLHSARNLRDLSSNSSSTGSEPGSDSSSYLPDHVRADYTDDSVH